MKMKIKAFLLVLLSFPALMILNACDNKPININACDISLEFVEVVFNGMPQKPSVAVVHNNKTLEQSVDYFLEYENNINAGTASVVVEGLSKFAEKKVIEFSIKPIQILSNNVEIGLANATYSGLEICPSLSVTVNNSLLSQNFDYNVSYQNNTNAGTATAVITGTGNYSGTIIKNFEISPLNFENADIIINETNISFAGCEVLPEYQIMYNNINLLQTLDFEIEVENNINIGIVEINFVGKGNYLGTQTKSFSIVALDISILNMHLENNQTAYEYTGEQICPTIDTSRLYLGTYQLTTDDFEISYGNNVQISVLGQPQAYVLVSGKNNFKGEFYIYFTIEKTA